MKVANQHDNINNPSDYLYYHVPVSSGTPYDLIAVGHECPTAIKWKQP